MKDISKIYENPSENIPFTPELQELLDKIISLKNPMDFNKKFATEEQLDAIENIMDSLETHMPELIKFINIVEKLKASETDQPVFI